MSRSQLLIAVTVAGCICGFAAGYMQYIDQLRTVRTQDAEVSTLPLNVVRTGVVRKIDTLNKLLAVDVTSPYAIQNTDSLLVQYDSETKFTDKNGALSSVEHFHEGTTINLVMVRTDGPLHVTIVTEL